MLYLVAAATLAVCYLILSRIFERLFTKRYCAEILGDQSSLNASLPSRLSLSVLPRSRVFRSVTLPIPSRDGEEIQLGTVAVNRSGIFIICQINGGGILENDPSGKWKHIFSGRCAEYENPFKAQQGARELISYYADAVGLGDVRAHSLIIYTDPSLRFTYQKPRGLISASELPSMMSRLEKRGRLSLKEVHAACKMLRNVDAY